MMPPNCTAGDEMSVNLQCVNCGLLTTAATAFEATALEETTRQWKNRHRDTRRTRTSKPLTAATFPSQRWKRRLQLLPSLAATSTEEPDYFQQRGVLQSTFFHRSCLALLLTAPKRVNGCSVSTPSTWMQLTSWWPPSEEKTT